MTETALMTTEQLLAIPDDGIERYLIRGELRTLSETREQAMTRRNPEHSAVTINIGAALKNRLRRRPKPRGRVLGGEAGFRIRRNPDTLVGIDVAYISAELAARTSKKAGLVDGAPVLAVEILSPSDKQEDIIEKIEAYIAAGAALVWEVDPVFETVRVHRPDGAPQLFNSEQELTAEPHLPGFRVPVAELFE